RSARLHSLRALELEGLDVDDSAVAALVKGEWPELRQLSLRGGGITTEGVTTLTESPLMGRLTHLSPGLMMGREGGRIAPLARCPGARALESLDLGICQLKNADLADLASADLPALRNLELKNNGLTAEAGTLLGKARWLGRLERLGLYCNHLGI